MNPLGSQVKFTCIRLNSNGSLPLRLWFIQARVWGGGCESCLIGKKVVCPPIQSSLAGGSVLPSSELSMR